MSTNLEDLAILRLPEVKRLTGLGRSSIYQMIKEGDFPRPVSLSLRAVGWTSGDIRLWLEARINNAKLS
jgi:prophage regulatory protein